MLKTAHRIHTKCNSNWFKNHINITREYMCNNYHLSVYYISRWVLAYVISRWVPVYMLLVAAYPYICIISR